MVHCLQYSNFWFQTNLFHYRPASQWRTPHGITVVAWHIPLLSGVSWTFANRSHSLHLDSKSMQIPHLGSLTPFFNLGVWRFLGFLGLTNHKLDQKIQPPWSRVVSEHPDPSVEPSVSGIRGSDFSAKIAGMNCAVLGDFFSSDSIIHNSDISTVGMLYV